ncbi:MAG: acid phosphatase, partial [Acidimicrobiales bacterium]|nr:acid phosphatase [Acidimicrobiales bacterium]
RYRVAMLIGDDLGDFLPDAEEMTVHDSVKTGQLVSAVAADPKSVLQHYAPRFGRDWFILPNPTYGSWEKAIVSRQICSTATPPLNSEDCYVAGLSHKRELLIGAP